MGMGAGPSIQNTIAIRRWSLNGGANGKVGNMQTQPLSLGHDQGVARDGLVVTKSMKLHGNFIVRS